MLLNDVLRIAIQELKRTNIFWTNWRVEFDDARTYAGSYDHRKRKIFLSRPVLLEADEELVLKIIRHQIAHAIAGFQTDVHNEHWTRIVKNIGGDPQASFGGVKFCRLKKASRRAPDSPVSRQFKKLFGDAVVIEMKQLPRLSTFRFSDYTTRLKETGEIEAFLEAKMWREISVESRLMKLFFQTGNEKFICIEAWQSPSGDCFSANRETDLKAMAVGNWYQLLTAKDGRGFLRIQSVKKLK